MDEQEGKNRRDVITERNKSNRDKAREEKLKKLEKERKAGKKAGKK